MSRGGGVTAIDHARRGRIARDGRKWAEAEASYEAALAASDAGDMTEAQRAEILGELGLAEVAQKKYREAAGHLSEGLSIGGALSLAMQQRFEAGLDKAVPHVVRLFIGVNPPDAEILLDGHAIDSTGPIRMVYVEPGRHFVHGRLSGYGDATIDFEVLEKEKGSKRNVSVRLTQPQPAPVVQKAEPAPVVTRSSTGDKFRIAGLIVSATAVTAGTTALVWAAAVHGELTAQVGELRDAGVPSDACRRSDKPSVCSELDDQADRRDALASFGLASLVGGIAVGVVTAGSFWVAYGPSPQREGLRVVPLTTGQVGGIALHGVW